MISTTLRNRLDNAMHATDPEIVWINETVGRIYQDSQHPLSVQFGSALNTWLDTAAIGSRVEIEIPNGLTGDDYACRRTFVDVTAEMVDAARFLAGEIGKWMSSQDQRSA